jgi:hypothetical protein
MKVTTAAKAGCVRSTVAEALGSWNGLAFPLERALARFGAAVATKAGNEQGAGSPAGAS